MWGGDWKMSLLQHGLSSSRCLAYTELKRLLIWYLSNAMSFEAITCFANHNMSYI